MLRPGTFALTALLAMLTGLGPLSVDMYLASMPDIGRLLAAPTAQVQLTHLVLSGRLRARAGVLRAAVRPSRPAAGAAGGARGLSRWRRSPARSRRRSRLLIAARFCPGGRRRRARSCWRARWCATCTRARASARELSRMAAIMALAPLVAPLIGGVLQTAFGWRSNFVAAARASARRPAAMVWLLLPETLRQRAPEPVSLVSIAALLSHAFSANAASSPISASPPAAWPGCSPGFPPRPSCCRTSTACRRSRSAWPSRSARSGYLIGTSIAARFVARWGIDRTMGLGCAAMAGGGLAHGAGAWRSARTSPSALVLAVGALSRRHGLALPQAQAGALLPFPDRAGAASSLVGFVQQTVVGGGRRHPRSSARRHRVAAGDRRWRWRAASRWRSGR